MSLFHPPPLYCLYLPSFSTLKSRSGAATPTRLSSPFVERNPAEELNATKFTIPQRNLQSSAPTNPTYSDSVLSQYNPRSQPPLTVPSPVRVLNGEAGLLADPNLSKIAGTEFRRRDYSQRTQQSSPPIITNSSLPGDQSGPRFSLRLGIAETPVRGRRLKLFQETSEESFEESLMIHGYAHRSGVGHNGRPSQTNFDRLRHPTPTTSQNYRSLPSATSVSPLADVPRAENATKRRRLESFLTSAPRTSKLRVVDVEGIGRILLGVEEETSVHGAPDGRNSVRQKRLVGRRKLKGNGKVPPSKRDTTSTLDMFVDFGCAGPDWLDTEFPWSLKADQLVRAHWETQAEKMRWIERFLDRDSDSESEGEEIMPSSAWGELYQHPPMPCRKGRGKMVPIKANDQQRTGTMVFPSDPADARAALLSRRAVRTLPLRRASRASRSRPPSDSPGSGEDEEFCICEGKIEDRGLVQCDDCERWYHLRCIGVRNAGELGGPKDPWYCTSCEKDTRRTVTPEPTIPSSEPTIVPTDDDCPGSSPKDPLFFVGDSERSPFALWHPHKRPSTPTREGAAFEPLSGSSSTAYSNKGALSTPRTSSSGFARIYETPSLSANAGDAESTFDLTTTPSRGMKFSSFTPKSIGPWSYNSRTNATGIGFHTPSKKYAGSFNRILNRVDSVSGNAPRPALQGSPTPTRKKEGAIGRVLQSRRSYESPKGFGSLSGGGRFGGPLVVEESPVMRSVGKKRMREEADLGDSISAEE